jgi:CRISPR-associated protein Csd2
MIGTARKPEEVVSTRYDFVILFDVQDGDPDAGNLPRLDPQTMHGLVTDVCLKRKVRDYILRVHPEGEGYGIFVQHGKALESQQELPYKLLKLEPDKKDRDKIGKARQWMCKNFYDVRSFGAVMSTTEYRCGQVRGPVQLTFARSIDPIVPLEHTITRVAFTERKKAETAEGETEMGRKNTVPYALYRGHGFVTPAFAADTGFTHGDLEIFWRALVNMFTPDRSAARGLMATRALYVFEHASGLGEAPAHRLFERLLVHLRPDIKTARSFSDYVIDWDGADLADGITACELVGQKCWDAEKQEWIRNGK